MSWLPKQTVVVPVDFSNESDTAVETALEMVEDASQVHVIHVLPVLAATEPGVIWDAVNDETRKEHTEKAIRERFSQDKYKDLRIAVAFGDPGIEITAFAKQINAQLVVIPSHGRTGLKRLLIGSVAERLPLGSLPGYCSQRMNYIVLFVAKGSCSCLRDEYNLGLKVAY